MITNPLTRLNDAFSDWLTDGGIFTYLDGFDVPWKNDDISSELDLEYHGNVSGEKIASPLVRRVSYSDTLTQEEKTVLARTIYAIHHTNWAKQWETMLFEYNPIENYRMVENMTDDEKVTEYGRTSTRTDNLTDTNTPNITNDVDNSTHGFNSTNAVPTDESTSHTTGTNTDTHTGTQGYVDGGTDTETRNYELTRSGNIGVTTSQQMIESERSLWVWNFFENVVFPDVDRVLTIPIY